MASNITPGNLDGTFPIAGIDNDSQGFRTNFANTATNFTAAKDEIEDLQNKAILKSALTGGSVDNDMTGTVLEAATLLDTRETIFDHGTITGPVPLDHQAGQFQTVTSSGSLVVSFVNFPTTTFGRVRLEVTIANTAHTVTLPSTVTIGNTAIRGLSGLIITFDTAGTYVFDFTSDDGSANWTIIDQTRGSAIPLPMLFNAQTGATYVPVLSDTGIMITMNNASANTVNIPDNSAVAYPIGTQLNIQQIGAGVTTIAAPGSDTLNSAGSLVAINGQWGVATALKMTATTWTLFGNLA